MNPLRLLVGLVCFVAIGGVWSCSPPDTGARIDATGLPSGVAFKPVAMAVNRRCGSLDCHGSKYRNMRLYGFGGLRLDPSDTPEFPAEPTQPEIDHDYDAIVSVEPEVMRQVVADKGQGSDRLTFVRKGRGAEHHKGGQRIYPGDDADQCIQSWFAGTVDATACAAVTTAF